MRPYVVYWNNIPSPYMVDRFNALASRGVFDFEAWFNDRTEPDRSWTVDEARWRFRHRYLPTTHFAGRTQHWPLPLLDRRPPDVLVSLYATPVFVAGWTLAMVRGVKTGFRVLMTHDSWVSRQRGKEALKRFMFRRVGAIETPGEQGREFALALGARGERIFITTHTVGAQFRQAAALPDREHREFLRRQIGLAGTTFLYVGRLWHGKGVEYLIGAFQLVQQQSSDEVSLLLVGDGPDEERLRRLCRSRRLRNVVFAGFKQRKELAVYYCLADVFVFPTLGDPYGLVVDEAMACSLPVISTSAAGEIRSRIEDGVNGFIVPPEDSRALAGRMSHLASDSTLRSAMGRLCKVKVQDHTPERWAEDFERLVESLIGASALYG